MDSKILELAKKLKRQAQDSIGISDIKLAPDIIITLCDFIEHVNKMTPVAFTIKDDSGYLYVNRMTTQGCDDDELTNQLSLLQKYCPEKQYSITPLYRLDK